MKRGGNTITSSDEIADTFSDHYTNISRNPHKKSRPEKNGKRKSEEEISYNQSFADRELKLTIKELKIQHLEKILYIIR